MCTLITLKGNEQTTYLPRILSELFAKETPGLIDPDSDFDKATVVVSVCFLLFSFRKPTISGSTDLVILQMFSGFRE